MFYQVPSVNQCLWWPSMGMGGGMWLWLIVLGLLGFGLYHMFRPRRRATYLRDDSPLEIARMRLARGEITSEEFEEIKSRIPQ